MYGFLFLGLVALTLIEGTCSWTQYNFKDNCDYNLYTVENNETVFVRYNHETLPNKECAVGFHSNQTCYKTCMTLTHYKVNDCHLKLKGSGDGKSMTWSCDGLIRRNKNKKKKKKQKKTFCSNGDLRISLHNANTKTNGEFSVKVYLVLKENDTTGLYWLIPLTSAFVAAMLFWIFYAKYRKLQAQRNSKKPKSAESPTDSTSNTNTNGPKGKKNQADNIGPSFTTNKSQRTSNKPSLGEVDQSQRKANNTQVKVTQTKEITTKPHGTTVQQYQLDKSCAETGCDQIQGAKDEKSPEQLLAPFVPFYVAYSAPLSAPPYEEQLAANPFQLCGNTNGSFINRASLYQVQSVTQISNPHKRHSNSGELFTVLSAGQAYDVLPTSDPPKYDEIYQIIPNSSEA